MLDGSPLVEYNVLHGSFSTTINSHRQALVNADVASNKFHYHPSVSLKAQLFYDDLDKLSNHDSFSENFLMKPGPTVKMIHFVL